MPLALHETIELIRMCSGFKVKDIAKELGVTTSYISQLKSGEKTFNIKMIEAYARCLNMKSSAILYCSENLNEGANFRDLARLLDKMEAEGKL
jgi:transcriptional regulator with XRE-family HTH domain